MHYIKTLNQIAFTDGANTINSTAITWVTTTDHNIIATWGSGLKLYIDGSLVASTSNFTQPSLWKYVYRKFCRNNKTC